MRKRGEQLNSPEANFIFGGPKNEQVQPDTDETLVAYDQATSAIDHILPSDDILPGDEILTQRDQKVKDINRNIHGARQIEAQRAQVAKQLSSLSSKEVDQQG